MYTYTHAYTVTYSLTHSFTHTFLSTDTGAHIHRRKKNDVSELFKDVSHFPFVYFTCDRDFIKRVKIFSARARRLSLVCEFFFFFFFFLKNTDICSVLATIFNFFLFLFSFFFLRMFQSNA